MTAWSRPGRSWTFDCFVSSSPIHPHDSHRDEIKPANTITIHFNHECPSSSSTQTARLATTPLLPIARSHKSSTRIVRSALPLQIAGRIHLHKPNTSHRPVMIHIKAWSPFQINPVDGSVPPIHTPRRLPGFFASPSTSPYERTHATRTRSCIVKHWTVLVGHWEWIQ